MKASILIYPNVSKINKRNGKIPLHMRIFFMRQKAECRLSADLLHSELRLRNPSVMGLTVRDAAVNVYIDNLVKRFEDYVRKLLKLPTTDKYLRRQEIP